MRVVDTHDDTTPRTVVLSPAEMMFAEIHSNLMDRGIDQGTAMVMMRGSDLDEGLRQPTPILDRVLSDERFVLWLTH